MFCDNCGKLLPEGSKYCNYCGAHLEYEAKHAEKTDENAAEYQPTHMSPEPAGEPVRYVGGDYVEGDDTPFDVTPDEPTRIFAALDEPIATFEETVPEPSREEINDSFDSYEEDETVDYHRDRRPSDRRKPKAWYQNKWVWIAIAAVAVILIIVLVLALSGGNKPTPADVVPTRAVTEAATEALTEEPTEALTEEPTEAPTEEPTEPPTEAPTEAPTEEPTEPPTEAPTEAPTEEPTEAPTEEPTEEPTDEPSEEPTEEEPITDDVPDSDLTIIE